MHDQRRKVGRSEGLHRGGILVLAVGRLRPSFREAADEYLKRLGRYLPVREVEVREAGKAGSDTVQRREEAKHLRKALPTGAHVVALTRDGRGWTSTELADRLDGWRESGRQLVVVIGGAAGLEEAFLACAGERWSLGPLTLPHELARIVVLEQLYRACTIHRGERYHKGRDQRPGGRETGEPCGSLTRR